MICYSNVCYHTVALGRVKIERVRSKAADGADKSGFRDLGFLPTWVEEPCKNTGMQGYTFKRPPLHTTCGVYFTTKLDVG